MKRFISWMLVLALVLPCFVVAVDAPAQKSEAEILKELGMLKGTNKGLELDRAVTRAEAVTMLYRITAQDEEEHVYQGYFTDVPESHWASGWIERAYEDEYVDGTGIATFTPDRSVSGLEFTKMLLSVLGYSDITLQNCNRYGKSSGILTEDQTLTPLTRGEVATLCYRALKANRRYGYHSGAPLYQTLTLGREKEAYFIDTMPKSFTDEMRERMPKDKNYMFSPFSIQIALAMTANGADDETKAEMLDVLQIEDLDAFNAQSKKLIEAYSTFQNVRLDVANAIWANQDTLPNGFQDEFQKRIKTIYHGSAEMTDMARAVDQINEWVKTNTNGKISGIISKDNLPFEAFIANAVYFKSDWEYPFDVKNTSRDTFTNRDGTKTEIDFMHQTEDFSYFEGNGVQMVRLPYQCEYEKDPAQISMYVILSDADIDAEYYVKTREMRSGPVILTLPKFETEWGGSIKETLRDMGINRAFDKTIPGFPAIAKDWPLYIKDVLHRTYINVDETGTEAAAVTGIISGGTGIPPKPVAFTADRPFTYVIYDETNGETLFVGEYAYAE